MKGLGRFASMLQVLENRHRRRALSQACGLDFASNDYLGLARSKVLQRAANEVLEAGVPMGSGGSRLLRGNHPEHEALEQEAADFFGTEGALFMGGGFQANQALFSTLPAAEDLVIYDTLIHASAHEGMRLGRSQTRGFAHNDVGDARRIIAEWRSAGGVGQIWIAVESIYSMEGDLAPLQDLSLLSIESDAILVVDEAHATGVYGSQGRGLAHDLQAEVLSLHTCGKALGVSGGLICGSKMVIDVLVNRARPFIFATAPTPFTAALVRASLQALKTDNDLVASAKARIRHGHSVAQSIGLPQSILNSQIIPMLLGDEARAMNMATALQKQGFDVRGIRPPTVPRGTSRLRISVTGNVGHADISALFDAISQMQRSAA